QPFVVYAPGDVVDQRTCGNCNCTSNAQKCTGTLTTYHTANCSDTGTAVVADGSCNLLPAGSDDHLDDHFILSLMPDTMACKGASQTPLSGQIKTTNPVTICCP